MPRTILWNATPSIVESSSAEYSAVHPVTTTGIPSPDLAARRIIWRDFLSASAVTVQVFIMYASQSSEASQTSYPRLISSSEKASLSYWLTLQPSVIMPILFDTVIASVIIIYIILSFYKQKVNPSNVKNLKNTKNRQKYSKIT